MADITSLRSQLDTNPAVYIAAASAPALTPNFSDGGVQTIPPGYSLIYFIIQYSKNAGNPTGQLRMRLSWRIGNGTAAPDFYEPILDAGVVTPNTPFGQVSIYQGEFDLPIADAADSDADIILPFRIPAGCGAFTAYFSELSGAAGTYGVQYALSK